MSVNDIDSQSLTEQIESQQKTIENLELRIAMLEGERSSTQKSMAKIEVTIDVLRDEIAALKKRSTTITEEDLEEVMNNGVSESELALLEHKKNISQNKKKSIKKKLFIALIVFFVMYAGIAYFWSYISNQAAQRIEKHQAKQELYQKNIGMKQKYSQDSMLSKQKDITVKETESKIDPAGTIKKHTQPNLPDLPTGGR